ncbi:MAG TPA: methyltransferase domain-containing protein [Polyangia bacterium]
MDVRSLKLHLLDHHVRLVLADERGERGHDLDGESFERVMTAAAPLLAALEVRLGGACHLALRAISIDPAEQVLRISLEGGESPGARVDGEAYHALSRALQQVVRAAVAEVHPRRSRDASRLDADFWNGIYREPSQGFELGRAAPPLARFFAAHPPAPGSRALVVGCGRAHEARLLARAGAEVVAVDLAKEALARARALTPPELDVTYLERDLFELASDPAERDHYDLVVEHACFCAIAPERRADYVSAMARLLRPGGELVGLFWAHGRPGGPPFGASEAELARLFGACFTLEDREVPRDSVALRQGEELLMRWKRRAT